MKNAHAATMIHSTELAQELADYIGTYTDVLNDYEFNAVTEMLDAIATYTVTIQEIYK